MKKIILRYGLISGCIAGVLLFGITIIFKIIGFDKVGFENSAYLGYTAILISMSVVYFGIKAFRDQHQEGKISFGKGLGIGLGIMLISCIMYSLAWLIVYYNFIPTFMDDYSNFSILKAQQKGASEAELAKITAQMDQMKGWYKNPFAIFGITMTEPMPVGILVVLISAFILKRK